MNIRRTFLDASVLHWGADQNTQKVVYSSPPPKKECKTERVKIKLLTQKVYWSSVCELYKGWEFICKSVTLTLPPPPYRYPTESTIFLPSPLFVYKQCWRKFCYCLMFTCLLLPPTVQNVRQLPSNVLPRRRVGPTSLTWQSSPPCSTRTWTSRCSSWPTGATTPTSGALARDPCRHTQIISGRYRIVNITIFLNNQNLIIFYKIDPH